MTHSGQGRSGAGEECLAGGRSREKKARSGQGDRQARPGSPALVLVLVLIIIL